VLAIGLPARRRREAAAARSPHGRGEHFGDHASGGVTRGLAREDFDRTGFLRLVGAVLDVVSAAHSGIPLWQWHGRGSATFGERRYARTGCCGHAVSASSPSGWCAGSWGNRDSRWDCGVVKPEGVCVSVS
jgi:hypothetical protein